MPVGQVVDDVGTHYVHWVQLVFYASLCVSRLRLSVAQVTHRVGAHDKVHRFAIQTTQFETSKTILQADSDQCGFPQRTFCD
jgi:hypothetical protein